MISLSLQALTGLIAAGAVFLIMGAALVWGLHRRRRRDARDVPLGAHDAVEPSVRRAEDVVAELNRKAERLERLIAEADDRIACLADVGDAPPVEEPLSEPSDTARTEILRLARQGVACEDIARRLGIAVGRIELVVNLDASHAGGG
ncbi:MAG: hypothetical protein KGY99_01520 [Phycisphaerae bacterium]|nr:hypothetical protein [Phycisphaerae bacterium]